MVNNMAGIISGTEFHDWVFDAFKQLIIEAETPEDIGVRVPHLRDVIAFDISAQYDGVVRASVDVSIDVDNARQAVDVAKKLFIATHAGASDPKIVTQVIGIRYEHSDDSLRSTAVVSLEGFFSADKDMVIDNTIVLDSDVLWHGMYYGRDSENRSATNSGYDKMVE